MIILCSGFFRCTRGSANWDTTYWSGELYVMESTMQLNFLTKNKSGFIDGSIKRDGFTTEIEKKQWDKCNAMVLSWIMSNVSKDLVSGILFRSNAAQVLLDLQERFDKVNMSRTFHLHKAIVTHAQGGYQFGGSGSRGRGGRGYGSSRQQRGGDSYFIIVR
nr:uncharacterized protein LOC104646995 [Solanum lycopersicum]